MQTSAYDVYWDDAFAREYAVTRCANPDDLLKQADIISLHTNLSDQTRGFINAGRIATMKDGALLINTARGGLIVEQDVAEACKSGKLGGYGTDVLEHEPMQLPHVFQEIDNVLVTPHVGSRTHESVIRQALRATNNLLNYLTGKEDYIQANK